MTHEEIEKSIIEARIDRIDALEAEFENWAYFTDEEKKHLDRIINALYKYDNYLMKKRNEK